MLGINSMTVTHRVNGGAADISFEVECRHRTVQRRLTAMAT